MTRLAAILACLAVGGAASAQTALIAPYSPAAGGMNNAPIWVLFGSTQLDGNIQTRTQLFDSEIECLRGAETLNQSPASKFTCQKLDIQSKFCIENWNKP